jgi:hypothetical protein
LSQPHNGLGARSAPRKTGTSRGLCRDIKGGALGQFALSQRARLDVSVDFLNLKDVNSVWGGVDINVPSAPQFGFGTARDVFNPFQTQIGVIVPF